MRLAPDDLLPWALARLDLVQDDVTCPLDVVAGDASNRRYFRLKVAGQSYVLAEAPPETEKNEAFLAVRDQLAAAGVRVPALFAADLDRGFLLLEDLGDDMLLAALNDGSVEGHYQRAFAVLLQLAAIDCSDSGLARYDRELLTEELARFPEWFVQQLLGYVPDEQEQALLSDFFGLLVDSALAQPRVMVHRDFHSRNLMLLDNSSLAVIDFQDAVVGPLTYDLVSLLRDCYRRWPAQQVASWALDYRTMLGAAGYPGDVDDAVFLRWFDWMGLQRHIKVLGNFSRLYLRDGKADYLQDLPLVLDYIEEITAKYAGEEPAMAAFRDWFDRRLTPLIARQDWSQSP